MSGSRSRITTWSTCVSLWALLACGGLSRRTIDTDDPASAGVAGSGTSTAGSGASMAGSGASMAGSGASMAGSGTATAGSGTGGSPPVNDPLPTTIQGLLEARARAQCEQELRCGAAWADLDSCVENANAQPAYLRYAFAEDYFSVFFESYNLGSPETLAACLDAVANSACDDERTAFEICGRALVPINPRGLGEACEDQQQLSFVASECDAGLVCDTRGACRRCVVDIERERGESCLGDGTCAPGLFCHPTLHTCSAFESLPKEGEACDDSQRCQNQLPCLFREGVFRCVKLPSLGQPCFEDSLAAACQYGLYCDRDPATGVAACRGASANGQPCTRWGVRASEQCLPGLACVFPSPDALEGTCGTPPVDEVLGCPRFSQSGLLCPAGTVPSSLGEADGALPSKCYCRPGGKNGDACTRGSDCQSLRCALDGTGATTCQARAAPGESCDLPSDCASLVCGDFSTCLACD